MPVTDQQHDAAKSQLRSVVERIENLEASKDEIAEEIKGVYQEAKSNGFDVKALRKLISIRKKDAHVLAEEQAILSSYLSALGMLSDLPLGQAATRGMIGHNSRSPQEPQEAGESPIHPQMAKDIERAVQRGKEAADDGLKAVDNPFLHEDPRHAAWAEGFSEQRRAA